MPALTLTLNLTLTLTLPLTLTLTLPPYQVGAGSASEQWKVIEALNGCDMDGRRLEAKEAHHNPTGLPRFQPAWLRGITSNITASLEAKIATVAGAEVHLELDPLKKLTLTLTLTLSLTLTLTLTLP